MGKSLEKVEQSDGSFKWEMVEFQPEPTETTKTKAVKKTAKKKTTNPLSE